VLTDWSADARPMDPRTIDWKAAAAGKVSYHARQLPGPWNSMGEMKFEMPNDYGIYLHDTPHKELFDQDDRWLSNGCVRLEDYRRFASWVFGRPPDAGGGYERTIELPRPVPVFLTYLTVAPGPDGGVVFRPDPYGHDKQALPQMFGKDAAVAVN
jgi:murein L,D-transpeptidase YcbB/YkuD